MPYARPAAANHIVNLLKEKLVKDYAVTIEPRLMGPQGDTLIPDMVAVKDRKATIIDPTVIYENNSTSVKIDNSEKIRKYSQLADQIRQIYGLESDTVRGFAVGVRGGWCSENSKTLKDLGVTDRGFPSLLCRYALRGTITMLRLHQDVWHS